MSAKNLLTKAAILKGAEDTKDVYIPSLGGEVTIRRLTSREFDEYQELQQKGVNIKGAPKMDPNTGRPDMSTADMQIDLASQQKHGSMAVRKAVALGLSVSGGEQWTADEVKEISPPPAVGELLHEIFKYSGLNQNEESEEERDNVRQFRPEPGGTADGDAASDGGADSGELSVSDDSD